MATSRSGTRISIEELRKVAKERFTVKSILSMQVAVFVMCGGGHLGRLAAQQPARFYIDDRVGKLPYSKRDIMQAVKILRVAAETTGLDPHKLPWFELDNLGVF